MSQNFFLKIYDSIIHYGIAVACSTKCCSFIWIEPFPRLRGLFLFIPSIILTTKACSRPCLLKRGLFGWSVIWYKFCASSAKFEKRRAVVMAVMGDVSDLWIRFLEAGESGDLRRMSRTAPQEGKTNSWSMILERLKDEDLACLFSWFYFTIKIHSNC